MRKTLFVVVVMVILGWGTLVLFRHHDNRVLTTAQQNTITAEGHVVLSVPSPTRESDQSSDPSTVEQLVKDNKFYYRSDSLVAENIDEHLEIASRGKSYRVDFDRLPVAKEDCPDFNNSKPCVQSVGVVAFDEPRGRVLLDVPTDTWKNVPMVMVGYELSTGTLTRYGVTSGVGIREGTASASGRYFGFVALGTAGGSCGIVSRVVIIDTRQKKMVQLEPPSFPGTDVVQMGEIKWIGESELSYDTTAFKRDDCLVSESYKIQGSTTRVNLADLAFPD